MNNYVSPVGYVELDNDCAYSLDIKTTKGRETVDPKTDLAFYFNTYIVPKYGLGNINVSNCASFMKDLEMNWSKLTPDLKDKVLDIMVDYIFKNGNDYDFKKRFIQKMGLGTHQENVPKMAQESKSKFGSTKDNGNNLLYIALAVVLLVVVLFMLDRLCKNKVHSFAKIV